MFTIKNSKFHILFEEIMKTTISVDSFDFKFEEDDSNNLICKFELLNKKNNKLLQVVATINKKNNITFTVDDGKIEKELTEKEFMVNYYSDYETFKQALTDYQNEKNNPDKTDKNNDSSKSELTKDSVPAIKSFESKLNKIAKKTGEIIIDIRTNCFCN